MWNNAKLMHHQTNREDRSLVLSVYYSYYKANILRLLLASKLTKILYFRNTQRGVLSDRQWLQCYRIWHGRDPLRLCYDFTTYGQRKTVGTLSTTNSCHLFLRFARIVYKNFFSRHVAAVRLV